MSLKLSTGFRNLMLGLKGAEKCTNGTFASDVSSWTSSSDTNKAGTISWVNASGAESTTGHAKLANAGTGTDYGCCYFTATLLPNKWYEVSMYFKQTGSTDSDGVRVCLGLNTAGGADDRIYGYSRNIAKADYGSGWTQFTFRFFTTTASSAVATLSARCTVQNYAATANQEVWIDQVRLKECSQTWSEMFNDCSINIYGTAQPASADTAAGGTPLCTIYSDGATATAGLGWATPDSGAIAKSGTETWSGQVAADGTALWFRIFRTGEDPNATSTVNSRVDGTISTSGADLNMSNTALTNGSLQAINSFQITLPAS